MCSRILIPTIIGLISIVALSHSILYAQVPNGGFEEWILEQNYERPALWMTNQDANLARFERDTQRVEGLYSLKILSETNSGWEVCANKAWMGIKLEAQSGKNRGLAFFVKSIPHSANISGEVHLNIHGKLFAEGSVIHEYSWKAETAIPEFTEIIIPLFRTAADSIIIEISGGSLSGATDLCSSRTISWVDGFRIIEIPDVIDSDCIERHIYSPLVPGMFFTNMFRQNDTLIVSGVLSRSDASVDQHPMLLRLDTTGQLFDHFVYLDSLWPAYHYLFNHRKNGLCPALDGGYLMSSQRGQNEVIWKVDFSGEIDWMKEYNSNYGSLAIRQIESVGDGYVVAGNIRGLNFEYDIFVMKIDLFGNKVWEQYYSTLGPNDDRFKEILIHDDTAMTIFGYVSPGIQSNDSRLFRTCIFAIDSLGNMKWQWESETSMDQPSGGIVHDQYGNWVYPTNYYFNESDGSFKVKPKLIIRNAEFELVNEQDLDNPDGVFNVMEEIIPITGGGFLGVGVNYEVGVPDNHNYGWIVRFDQNGDVLWERKEVALPDDEFPSFQILHSALELPGGNIIAAGYTYSNQTEVAQGFLIKVNACGCLDTICEISSSSGIFKGENSEQIIVYPNPANDLLTFHLDADIRNAFAELYDLTGRELFHKVIHGGETTIALENIPAGIVAWRVISEKGTLIGQGKVVVSD